MTEQPDLYDWQPLVDDLERRQAQALAMGGEQQVERQRGMGKLPVRERIDRHPLGHLIAVSDCNEIAIRAALT